MNAIRAVVRNGRLETEEPVNLPDGTEITISLPDVEDREPGWDTSPEAIAAWIARDQATVPPPFDPVEWEESMAWLKAQDRQTLQNLQPEQLGEAFP
jgi:hypothetical protein